MASVPSKEDFEEAAADLEATAALFAPCIEKLSVIVDYFETQDKIEKEGGRPTGIPRTIDVAIDDLFEVHQMGERTFLRYLHLYQNSRGEWISTYRQQFGMNQPQGYLNVFLEKKSVLLKYSAFCRVRANLPAFPANTPATIHHHHGGTTIMRDQYQNVTGIAVGPNARVAAEKIDIWKVEVDKLDLAKLAESLSALRPQLRSQDPDDEHEDERLQVSAAEKAARKGDGGRALGHLKEAGKWALEVASKIGETIAVKAISSALKLPSSQ